MLTARKYRNRASKLVILSIGSRLKDNAFDLPVPSEIGHGSTLIQSAERKVRIQLSALSPYQKNTRDSAIIGDERNAFCPRFCPRRKAIKDPGWCGLDAPGQQFIHRPRTWLSQPTWPKTSKTLPKPWPPSLPSSPSSLLSGGFARAEPAPRNPPDEGRQIA